MTDYDIILWPPHSTKSNKEREINGMNMKVKFNHEKYTPSSQEGTQDGNLKPSHQPFFIFKKQTSRISKSIRHHHRKGHRMET